ncbi:MAG: 1,2-phenylacetyl-CoA epoxidase subunit PaaD [Pseudomonadales bacterium]
MTAIAAIHPEQMQRQHARDSSQWPELWALLDQVKDPEIPVLSIWDLGVLRDVAVNDQDQLVVNITPTYSGCPAMKQIEQDIKDCLESAGHADVVVNSLLSPAWSTDWMTAQGRAQLKEYGIAPPEASNTRRAVACPQCQSADVQVISEFGSTACKALYKCNDCLEPFDYFKCI